MKCSDCDGKGSFSVYTRYQAPGDFEGDTITGPTQYIARRKCKHCNGSGKCTRKNPPCTKCTPKNREAAV